MHVQESAAGVCLLACLDSPAAPRLCSIERDSALGQMGLLNLDTRSLGPLEKLGLIFQIKRTPLHTHPPQGQSGSSPASLKSSTLSSRHVLDNAFQSDDE